MFVLGVLCLFVCLGDVYCLGCLFWVLCFGFVSFGCFGCFGFVCLGCFVSVCFGCVGFGFVCFGVFVWGPPLVV